MSQLSRYEVNSLAALDALIDARLAGRTDTGQELATLDARAEELAAPKRLIPRRILMETVNCTCLSCSRSWVQEEGLYLFSESTDLTQREYRLLSELSELHRTMPIQTHCADEKRRFPMCIRCVIKSKE